MVDELHQPVADLYQSVFRTELGRMENTKVLRPAGKLVEIIHVCGGAVTLVLEQLARLADILSKWSTLPQSLAGESKAKPPFGKFRN